MKLLIDTESGTIVNADNCYIVDTDDLTLEEEQALEVTSDEETSDIARKHGISLKFMGDYSGWGDVNYGNSVSYSPNAIRDELDLLQNDMPYVKDSIEWVRNINKETLEVISAFAISNEKAWLNYHSVLLDAIEEVYARKVLYPLEDLEA